MASPAVESVAVLRGTHGIGSAVPYAAGLLARPGTRTRNAFTDCHEPLPARCNTERELRCRIDALLRHLVVALHTSPATVHNIACGAQSPVHGEDRDLLAALVAKHLRAATSRTLDTEVGLRTVTYETVGALAAAWRHNGER